MLIRRNKKELAFGMCHAVYRNTAVEDLHEESPVMDGAFYRDVYRIVSEKIPFLFDLKNELAALCTVGLPCPPLPESGSGPEELGFLWEVIAGLLSATKWDEPCAAKDPPGDDLAAYLLDGTFKEYCDGKHRFDDSVMKPINKDITNRCCRILKEILPEESPEAKRDHDPQLLMQLMLAAKPLEEEPWIRVGQTHGDNE